MKRMLTSSLLVLAVGAGAAAFALAQPRAQQRRVERGQYLVTALACTDCHTPWVVGPQGPAPDETRLLSGHPEALVMPPAPRLAEGPWTTVVSGTNTAWAGPWGVSYTANLTPDEETGLGRWSEEQFLETLRSARHLGRGRPLLPPMPAQAIASLTDEDLRSVFAYLRSIPAVRNAVPAPLPPSAH